jgi:hypothetical protein
MGRVGMTAPVISGLETRRGNLVHLTWIAMLTEYTWVAGTRPDLDRALSGLGTRAPAVPGTPKRWAVMLEGEEVDVIIGGPLTDNPPAQHFEAYLDGLHGRSFSDAIYAVETYYQAKRTGCGLPDPYPLRPAEPVIDDLLRESRGWLLWQFQLENVCGLFMSSRTRAMEFRRRLNQRHPDAWREAARMRTMSGRTLDDVLEERMVFGQAVPGLWKSGSVLFEYLKRSKKRGWR